MHPNKILLQNAHTHTAEKKEEEEEKTIYMKILSVTTTKTHASSAIDGIEVQTKQYKPIYSTDKVTAQ